VSRGRILAIGLVAALGCAGAALALAVRMALGPASHDGRPVVIEVPAGAPLSQVSRHLADAGLLRSTHAFEILARWRGVAGALRAGEYELSPSLTASQVLDDLVRGRVRMHRVALPEGLTAVEIAARLEDAGLADAQAFLGVVRDPETAMALGVEGGDLEGYLFPETYHFARGVAPLEIARAMVAQFRAVWSEIESEAEDLGLSMRKTVILASLVEKETGAPEERPLIAAVFHNRLRRSMRLETDPAVIYGISDFDGRLRRIHLEDEGNPYNTYRIPGLPPGPIANPGAAALRSVVHPAESDHLFFVSRNDGTHVFSRTYREHAAAVRRHQNPNYPNPAPRRGR
jgi:UPF0755 protein